MRKITAIITSIMIFFSVIGVSAASVPSFMEEIYTNYTADYKLSLKLENADEIIGFLKEVYMSDEVYNYVDMKALIESLGSFDSKMNVRAEMSSDFRKIKVSLTSETTHKLVLNRNFSTNSRAGVGIWVEFDADNKKFRVIYSTPANEKYAVIDSAKDFPDEISEKIFEMYDKILTPDFIRKNNEGIIGILAEYADVTVIGTNCKVKIDNEAFLSIINDVLKNMTNTFSSMKEIVGEDFDPDVIPEIKDVKLLGDKGITLTYKLYRNKIKSVSEEWDVSISVSDICTAITGEPWEYENSGDINFSLKSECEVKKIGSTKADIPEINEKNSFSIPETMNWFEDYYEIPEDNVEIRTVYSWSYGCSAIAADGKYYMPVRECIEDVYNEWVTLSYDNGCVTVITDCLDPEKELNMSFKVGEDRVTVNGKEYTGNGAFRNIGGTVYATSEFYENCLGWELVYLNKDLLNGEISYEFNTVKEID